jgi:hypothetical protein
MKSLDAGPNGVRLIGQIYDVDDKEGKELIKGGYAEKVEEQKPQKQKPKELEPQTIDFSKVPDLEGFIDLKAEEQRAWLEHLEIEGDDSNEEKRVALFEGYLLEVSSDD